MTNLLSADSAGDADPQILKVAGKIRSYIAAKSVPTNERLPPELELAKELNVTRGRLRQAFAVLEQSGEIWRHVGKGTFVGDGTQAPSRGKPDFFGAMAEDASILERTSPLEVLEARLLIEPKIAAFAAIRGTPSDFRALKKLLAEENGAKTAEAAQAAGSRLHRTIAKAARNELLDWLFEKIFAIRAATSWGMIRTGTLTPSDLNFNHREHDDIVGAIARRDPRGAEAAMRKHLESLQRSILAGIGP